jgi:hypothetical protein
MGRTSSGLSVHPSAIRSRAGDSAIAHPEMRFDSSTTGGAHSSGAAPTADGMRCGCAGTGCSVVYRDVGSVFGSMAQGFESFEGRRFSRGSPEDSSVMPKVNGLAASALGSVIGPWQRRVTWNVSFGGAPAIEKESGGRISPAGSQARTPSHRAWRVAGRQDPHRQMAATMTARGTTPMALCQSRSVNDVAHVGMFSSS